MRIAWSPRSPTPGVSTSLALPSPLSVKLMKPGSGKPGSSLVAESTSGLPSGSDAVMVNCLVSSRFRLTLAWTTVSLPLFRLTPLMVSHTGGRLMLSTVIGTLTVLVSGVPVPSPLSTAVNVTS